jgi:hypothetical protein
MVTWASAAILAWSVAVPAPVVPAVSPTPRPEQVMAVPPELRAQLQQQVIRKAVGDNFRSTARQVLPIALLRDAPGETSELARLRGITGRPMTC